MSHPSTSQYPPVPTVDYAPINPSTAYYAEPVTGPSNYPDGSTAPRQSSYPDGDDTTARGVESTLDSMLRAKHKMTHPTGHVKHKIKQSRVGKPLRIVEKLKRLCGR